MAQVLEPGRRSRKRLTGQTDPSPSRDESSRSGLALTRTQRWAQDIHTGCQGKTLTYGYFEIYSEAKLEEKLRTIHSNPVRAGVVAKTVDWKWSSARWYEQGKSVGVALGWVV